MPFIPSQSQETVNEILPPLFPMRILFSGDMGHLELSFVKSPKTPSISETKRRAFLLFSIEFIVFMSRTAVLS